MYLFRWDGDHESLRRHRRRLAALVENFPSGQPVTSLAYSTLASICSRLADEEPAWETYADLAIGHAPPDSLPLEAMARCQKARALMFRGEHEQAIAVLEDAAAKSDAAAEGYQFYPQEDLALAHHLAGNHERALAIAEARLCQTGLGLRWYVAVYAALAAAALGDQARARTHLRAAVERETALSMPLTVNDCRMAVGAMALLRGRPSVAVDMLAALATGSTSFNTLGILLRHYQDLAKRTVSPAEWERAAAVGVDVDPWPLIEAELADDQSSVTSTPSRSDAGAATLP
jgi:tetratricopeptide (TPR) repeat protein